MLLLRKLIVFGVLCLASAQAVEVSAQLSADRVEAGQGVMLTVRVTGGSPEGPPSMAEVKNLIVNQRGQSQQMKITNGKMTRSISYTYVVGSMEAGEYEIPAATVTVKGEAYQTEALKLTVIQGANGAPAGMGEEEDTAAVEEKAGDFGYLTFRFALEGREKVYPGEIAPVRIRAFFPMDTQVSLSGPPRPEGSAFTLHNLTEEPQQSIEVVNDKRYRVVTWFGGLSATKAGSYPASFGLEARVAVRDPSANRRQRRSVFDDFFAPMIEKDVVLTIEEPPAVEVVELPKEGRPDDFTGAIGEFEFASLRVPAALSIGEPCRIEAVLKGSGNFSLLKEPHPQPEEDWKVYEGKSDFAPGDVASFAGEKRFEFNAVPLAPGDDPLVLSFSYFDPEKGEYRRVESEPQPVVITGEVVKPVEVVEAKELVNVEPEGPQLAPLRTELGRLQSYQPVSDRDWFMPVIGSSVALTFGILAFGWWMGRKVDHAKVARLANDAATREALSRAERAMVDADAFGFFMAARDAIRVQVGEKSGVRPEAVTVADLRDPAGCELADILNEADRIDYSGRTIGAEALNGWKRKLDKGLEQLSMERSDRAT